MYWRSQVTTFDQNIGSWITTFWVAFILNQGHIKLCLIFYLFPCNMAAERSWSLAFTCFGARLLCFNFSTTDFPLADHSSTRASIWRQCELQNRKDNKSDANLNSKLWLSQRGPQVLLVQKIYCVCYIKHVFAFHISR